MSQQDPTFAEAFEQLRQARGLKPADIARELDVYPGEVSRWRRGGGISITNVRKVAEFFGADRNWLEGLAGYPDSAVSQQQPRNPRLTGLFAAIETAFNAMSPQEWEVREPAALSLFAVPPTDANTHPGRDATAPRRALKPALKAGDKEPPQHPSSSFVRPGWHLSVPRNPFVTPRLSTT